MSELINFKKDKIWTKYKLRCNYCGSEHWVWLWWLKFNLIFTDKVILNCPVCHHQSHFKNQFHLVHDSTDTQEKLFNRNKKWDDRIE